MMRNTDFPLPERPRVDGLISDGVLGAIGARLWVCGQNSADIAAFCGFDEARVWSIMTQIRAGARNISHD